MKNITVSVDDETYRRARVAAAQRDTSVSSLVKKFLSELVGEETEFERLKRIEAEAREKIVSFSAGERLTREQVHERK